MAPFKACHVSTCLLQETKDRTRRVMSPRVYYKKPKSVLGLTPYRRTVPPYLYNWFEEVGGFTRTSHTYNTLVNPIIVWWRESSKLREWWTPGTLSLRLGQISHITNKFSREPHLRTLPSLSWHPNLHLQLSATSRSLSTSVTGKEGLCGYSSRLPGNLKKYDSTLQIRKYTGIGSQ